MCGRFGLALSNEQLTELLDLPQEIEARARYNIAPSQRIMALRNAGAAREFGESSIWGRAWPESITFYSNSWGLSLAGASQRQAGPVCVRT